MICRWLYIAVVVLFPLSPITAQQVMSSTHGKWTFTSFPGNIIKSTFLPGNHLLNEQISNAVIARPVSFREPSRQFAFNATAGSVDFYHGGDTLTLLSYFDSAGYEGFRFRLQEGEKIFGSGERSIPLNRRGFKLDLYNTPHYGYGLNGDNLNYTVPFIISSGGYGIFFDNPSKSYLDIGKTKHDILEYGASSGKLDLYIIPGNNIGEIVAKYQSLTGTQPIPARWVFGNFMSRFGYRSRHQLLSTLEQMKQQDFPVDAVIIDLFWFGDSIKGTLGNLDWVNRAAWPDPQGMITNLRSKGIKTILITEPYVLRTTSNYDVSKKFHAVDSAGNPFVLTNFYFGNGGLLDIFRKDAQDWFWSKYKKQIGKGVAGWWGDLGEPETHPETMWHNLKDLGFKKSFNANEVHNIYGHYWDKLLFDKYANEYPRVRLFNLNRSGYAGSQRYGIFPWSGDVGRNWDGLKAQLPVMIGMSLSGVPYIHADAGGFGGGDIDEELYTRWLQFATFTPVFRPHGTALGDADPTVKDIPSEACFYPEPYKSIVRRYMNQRYALLPYHYTLAYEEAKFGKILVRPLFYYDGTDSNLFMAEDEYYWGDNLLIAPVLEKGATTRKVYLPKGQWYSLKDNRLYLGGTWINEQVDIDNIPVYVKEGSFIPMADYTALKKINCTDDYTNDRLVVKYYPSSQTTSYTLFLDDGVTTHTLENRKYVLVQFTGRTSDHVVQVKISASGNNLLTKVPRVIKLMVPALIESARINNKIMPVMQNFSYPDVPFARGSQYVLIKFSGRPVLVTLKTK